MNDKNMRVLMSKKMLKDGLFRCMQKKPLEKITVSEICREAQVNRTTFYNHYTVPRDILLESGLAHAEKIKAIFQKDDKKPNEEKRLEVLKYIYSIKDELKVLFLAEADANIENSATDFFAWFVDDFLEERKDLTLKDKAEYDMLCNCLGWSSYFLIRQWLLRYEDKTPEEMHKFFIRLGKGF